MKHCQMHPKLRNAPKHVFRVQWGGMGAFVAKNFDATLWHKLVHWMHQFNPFCTMFRVVTKHWQMRRKTTKHNKTWAYGPMGWIRCVRYENFRPNFVARTFALITPVQPILHRVSCSNEMVPNAPKHYETHQNMSLGSNGVDRVRSLRKILMRLHGTNLCINCTSSTHLAPSSV